MRVDVKDAQPSIEAALLRNQRRANRGVVATQHDRQGALRRLSDFCGHGVDIGAHIAIDQRQVAIVLDGDGVEQLGVLADGREDGRQLS